MTTKRHYKPFTNKEIERVKQMYLIGESLKAIAEVLSRTPVSISAVLNRLIHDDKVLVMRSTALIALGGIDAAQKAVEVAKHRGAKTVRFLTKNCAYSNIPITDLENHISRYKQASHLSGVQA